MSDWLTKKMCRGVGKGGERKRRRVGGGGKKRRRVGGEEKKSINDFSACPECQSETTFPTHSPLSLPLPTRPTHPEGEDNLNSLLDLTEHQAATDLSPIVIVSQMATAL